jgi:uncharacterized coiled-coil DUF342 family protein
VSHVSESANQEPSIDELKQHTRGQLAFKVKKLTKQYRALEATNKQSNLALKELALEAKELCAKNEQTNHEYQTLDSKHQTLSSKYQTLNSKYQTLSSECTNLNLGHLNLNSEYHALKSEHQALEFAYRALTLEHDKCENELQSPQAQCDEHLMGSECYDYIRQKYIDPYALSKNTKYQDDTEQSMKKVLDLFLHDALDATALRAQVQGLVEQVKSLQEQLLSNVEKVQAVSDDQFASDFRALASSIKSLSRSIKLSEFDDILGIGEIKDCHLVKGVAPVQWSTRPRQKCLIEAFVWSVLYTEVFNSPCKCSICFAFSIIDQLH